MLYMVYVGDDLVCPNEHDCNSTTHYIVAANSPDAAARVIRDRRRLDECAIPDTYLVLGAVSDGSFELSNDPSSAGDEHDAELMHDLFKSQGVEISLA